MLKAYFFEYDVGWGGKAIIAENAREAKKLFWRDPDVRECCGGEWVYLKVRWIKGADTEGLEAGHIVGPEGLRRGIYSSYRDDGCPLCGNEYAIVEYFEDWDIVCCSECGEKMHQDLQRSENETS